MLELEITIQGRILLLSGSKAVFDPQMRILYIADLHAGKAATLRMHGVPLPEDMLRRDLARLSDLIDYYKPEELIVLGDFFHARAGRLPEVFHELENFRNKHRTLPIVIVEGNHDRAAGIMPSNLALCIEPEGLRRGIFSLAHFPSKEIETPALCGHLHPATKVPGIGKLACFVQEGNQLILPSFASTTDGCILVRERNKQFFVTTPEAEVYRY